MFLANRVPLFEVIHCPAVKPHLLTSKRIYSVGHIWNTPVSELIGQLVVCMSVLLSFPQYLHISPPVR